MTQSEINLIQGKFLKPEAFELLMNLLQDKIKFHERKNFSSEERFGHSCSSSLERIENLKKTCSSLKDIISSLGDETQSLEMEAIIKVRIAK